MIKEELLNEYNLEKIERELISLNQVYPNPSNFALVLSRVIQSVAMRTNDSKAFFATLKKKL